MKKFKKVSAIVSVCLLLLLNASSVFAAYAISFSSTYNGNKYIYSNNPESILGLVGCVSSVIFYQ
jgi:hypothetical protein